MIQKEGGKVGNAEQSETLEEETDKKTAIGICCQTYAQLEFDDFPIPPKDASKRELGDYRNIRAAAARDRKGIKRGGRELLISLSQHPQQFTRGELARLEERDRTKTSRGAGTAKGQFNYTDPKRPHVFRCPLEGCGGDILNGHSVEWALEPHFNKFRPLYLSQKKVCTFKLQSHGRKWRYFTHPPQGQGKGGAMPEEKRREASTEGIGTQEESEGGEGRNVSRYSGEDKEPVEERERANRC